MVIPAIIHPTREGFLKVALLVWLLYRVLGGAAPAGADELVVGALRDQDGAVVAGARVTARAASGAAVARDTTASDGTFALTAPQRPASLTVEADDADPLRLPVPAQGPVTGVVQRHRATDRIPSAADVAALPAGGLAEIATTIPYWIAFPGGVSDRWLDRGRGVTTVEGLPFYRRGDGSDVVGLLPDRATGAVAVAGPLRAPWYGDRAGGGVIDAQLFDRVDTGRIGNRDGALLVGRDPAVLAATSWDPDGVRRLIAARGGGTLGPVAASLVALAGDRPGAHYAGVGATLRAATRTLDVGAGVDLTRDVADDMGVPDAGNVTAISLDASGRGPDALAVRARWRDERGVFGTSAVDHQDAGLVIGTTRGAAPGPHLAVALALALGTDRAPDGVSRNGTALLPSLAYDVPLSRWWTFHSGVADSTLGTPGIGIARASLGEIGFHYADHRRFSAEFLAYAEGDNAPLAVTRGLGASLGWELAPRLSLRAWSLRSGDMEQLFVQEYPGGPLDSTAETRTFQRDLVWATWDAPMRFDLLVRAGALEGGVRIPLGGRYALAIASARRLIGARRVFSIGLTAR